MDPATVEHRCQPFAGVRGDPDLPATLQRRPWCWSPAVGFHRADRPRQPLPVRAATGTRPITTTSLSLWQAFRLGLGVGTTNLEAGTLPTASVLHRPLEICTERTWTGDVDPIAWYGYRCRGLNALDDDPAARRRSTAPRSDRSCRAGSATGTKPSPQPWRPPLTAPASDGAGTVGWAAPHASDGYRRLGAIGWDPTVPGYRAAMLDYAAGTIHTDLTRDPVGHGLFRSIVRLFALTGPDQARIIDWLLLITRTAHHHTPADPQPDRARPGPPAALTAPEPDVSTRREADGRR